MAEIMGFEAMARSLPWALGRMPRTLPPTRLSVLRFGVPLAFVAATAAIIGLEELRLAVVGPPVVEVRGTPLAGPWIPRADTGRVLLPVARPGDSTSILAMVSTEGLERARELLGAEKAVRIRGFARQPSSEELAEISRAAKGRGLQLDPEFAILDTGTGRAALPAAIILFAAGAVVLASGASVVLKPLRRRVKRIRSKRKTMRHTSPDLPEDSLASAEPEPAARPEPAPAPALETELEPLLVTLGRRQAKALGGIEPLDPSSAAVSRLARSLALSALESMRTTSRPLDEEAKREIHRQIQEIWDRV